jgi:hypothetical protein
VPIFVDVATIDPFQDPYYVWATALFTGIYTLFINPVVGILAFAALYAQARVVIRWTPGSGLGAY